MTARAANVSSTSSEIFANNPPHPLPLTCKCLENTFLTRPEGILPQPPLSLSPSGSVTTLANLLSSGAIDLKRHSHGLKPARIQTQDSFFFGKTRTTAQGDHMNPHLCLSIPGSQKNKNNAAVMWSVTAHQRGMRRLHEQQDQHQSTAGDTPSPTPSLCFITIKQRELSKVAKSQQSGPAVVLRFKIRVI